MVGTWQCRVPTKGKIFPGNFLIRGAHDQTPDCFLKIHFKLDRSRSISDKFKKTQCASNPHYSSTPVPNTPVPSIPTEISRLMNLSTV